MKIFVVGLSHKTAPIAVRDNVAVTAGELVPMLDILKSNEVLHESLLLSTCNRTELYGLIPKKCLHETSPVTLFKSLFRDRGVSLDEHLYYYSAEEAVKHPLCHNQ